MPVSSYIKKRKEQLLLVTDIEVQTNNLQSISIQHEVGGENHRVWISRYNFYFLKKEKNKNDFHLSATGNLHKKQEL